MSRPQLLRIATLVVFLGVAVVAVIRFFPETSRTERPAEASGELTVESAIHEAGTDPVTVRGFVFLGPGSLPLRVCTGIEQLEQPECLGPYLVLQGVNEGSFQLREVGEGDDARRYQEESVSLLGVISGTDMLVQQVLQ